MGAVAKTLLKLLAYSQTDANGNASTDGLTSYPTTPGVFRVVNPITGLPDGILGYGTLVIFDAGGYMLHLYRDGNSHFYVGRTEDGTKIPTASNWKHCFDAGDTISIANGGTGATDAATARANLGAQAALGFTPVQQGLDDGRGNNKIRLAWDPYDEDKGAIHVFVDGTEIGRIVVDNASFGGVTPVENGGTGANSKAGILRNLHSEYPVTANIATFGSGYENGGHCTPTDLKKAMGIHENFRVYHIDTSMSNPFSSISANWSSILGGPFMLTLKFVGGSVYSYVGYKVDENHGALIELSFGSGAIYKYTVQNGTWSEFAHNV